MADSGSPKTPYLVERVVGAPATIEFALLLQNFTGKLYDSLGVL